jgi:hypothetical protein
LRCRINVAAGVVLGFIDVTTYYHGTPRSDRPSDSGSLDRARLAHEGSSALVEKTDLTQAIGDTWLARVLLYAGLADY